MKIKRVITIVALASCLLPLTAQAAAPDYDYLQLGYASFNDPSSSGIDSDHAYGISGSYNINGNLVVGAAYSHETADFHTPFFAPTGKLTGDTYGVGLGYRIPLNGNWDLFPNLSYVSSRTKAELLGASNSETDTGYDAGLLLRGMVTEQVELDAGFDHSTPGSSSNTVSVGALYNFTHNFAMGVGYESTTANGQDGSGWQIAFRYYFR